MPPSASGCLWARPFATLTRLRPPHFHALGKQAFARTARDVDRKLAEVARSFDVLTSVTPINVDQSWRAFRSGGYEREPRFLYRAVSVNPDEIKRQVWRLPIDRVEDPSMEAIFRAKQRELDIQASMLLERGSAGFIHNSQRLYGSVPDSLLEDARQVIAHRSGRRKARDAGGRRGDRASGRSRSLTAAEFAALASRELDEYRRMAGEDRLRELGLPLGVEVLPTISGMVTVQGRLLVGSSLRVLPPRAEALVQHEVGTHILTFLNGMVQPISLLGVGLDGYEALQEGVAVLAEFFTGGLDRRRLRLLAARVLAAWSVQEGSEFVETFRLLRRDVSLRPRQAFLVAMRVHRGGGFIKDHIYLQGLSQVMSYLAAGGDLELLWTGKVGVHHVQLLKELRHRRILAPPMIVPRYEPNIDALSRCRTPVDLLREQ